MRDGELVQVKYSLNPLQSYIFDKDGDNFRSESINLHPDQYLERKHGVIEKSLFLTSQSIGLSETIMRFAQIFQWDVDFVLILDRAMHFPSFLSLFTSMEKSGGRRNIGCDFRKSREIFQALAFATQNDRLEYFTPAENMRKAFLRAPLNSRELALTLTLDDVIRFSKR